MESELFDKLTVLSDGAKYDVSCSSSGAARTNVGRIGSAACAGICHSWAADGRCISLLKVLLSNDCAYDCSYCVNRRTADTKRATFEPRELADLTMEFYRRNYIEGLFLSSAVLRTPDYTAECMIAALYILREVYGFAGYIHAKVIPGLSAELLYHLGLMADRLSVNIELPSERSLEQLAPQKKPDGIFRPMAQITHTQREQRTLKSAGFMDKMGRGKPGAGGENISIGDGSLAELLAQAGREAAGSSEDLPLFDHSIALTDRRRRYREKFAPAGQTTQMIVGASGENDRQIIHTSEALYRKFSMKRVYFSAYIPVRENPNLPPLYMPPPLSREHRLYQADFLLRFYGFTADEILGADQPNLDPELDPKIIWALRNIHLFPVEVNKADLEELMRIPGIGYISAKRIVRQRRLAAVRYDDLKKMGVVVKRARFFLTCSGKYYGESKVEPFYIRDRLKERKNALVRDAQDGGLLEAETIRRAMSGVEKYHQISMFEALTLPGRAP